MVRVAAKRSKDGPQARRLLALAAIYEGASRSEAAKIGGVTLQIVRDWVLKFNAPNITLIRLPAKCPELNPQENVWQFMRDNWLSNRIFKSLQDILDPCCDAWNKLVDQPWKIISIAMRDWAYRS